MNVLLAHGILGFGSSWPLPTPVHYFNGVAAHMRRSGHRVFEPQVNSVGSIVQRGAQLGAQILQVPLAPTQKLHVVAHSMGGLDVRHALARVEGVRERVATLTTIGTPHEGSPVADAVVARAGPLFAHCPRFVRDQLEANSEGLHDLTTSFAQAFNASTPDALGVRYLAVAGNADAAAHELLLFRLAEVLGQVSGETNDGVVTRNSALRDGYELLPDWPTDHAGEIGWTIPPIPWELPLPLPAPAHFARYDDILSRL